MTLALMRVVLELARLVLAPLLGLMLIVAFATTSLGQTEAERAQLDKLFAELKLAPDAQTANQIDQQIWLIWTLPAEPGLASRMAAILAARNAMDLGGAIRLLDQLVAEYPTYAEGWNQRATIYYMLDNYEASLADIDKVLEFEPRHFGALSGQAMIYLSLGKRPLALKAMAAALAVHPFLNERQLFPELMQDITRI